MPVRARRQRSPAQQLPLPRREFEVRATLSPGSLRVEVQDEGGLWHEERCEDGLSGRGLTIVAALAHWGITSDETGARTVWFEIPCR
jgi:hypothetical protein